MQGAPDSMDFRIFFKQQKDGAVVSPWHDIPLYAGASTYRSMHTSPSCSASAARNRSPIFLCCHVSPIRACVAGDGLINFVCEIPKESAAKMEVATVSVGPPGSLAQPEAVVRDGSIACQC